MKKLFFLLCLLFLWRIADAELYHHVQIPLSGPVAFKKLAGTGISLEEGVQSYVGGIRLILSGSEIKRVQNAGFAVQVIRTDMEKFYASRLPVKATAEFANGNMGGYYTYDEVVAKLHSYRGSHKRIFSELQTIGYSMEGRPILAFKISDNPDVEEKDEPEVLYTALHHAREPQSLMCLIYFVERLLKRYGRDKELTYLVDNRQLWFVPVVNPDGYVYNQQTNPGGGGLWRKNRRAISSTEWGVDLNRNYGFMWGRDDFGSSPSPSSDTYRGTAPFSEPETQAIRDFTSSRKIYTAFNYHSYGNLLIYPWGYADGNTPHHKIFRNMGLLLARSSLYEAGNVSSVLFYTANGNSDDWFYGDTTKFQTFAITPEVGDEWDGFWPPSDKILHYSKKTYPANVALAWMPGGYAYIKKVSMSELEGNGDQFLVTGEKWQMSLTIGNLGFTEAVKDISIRTKRDFKGVTVEELNTDYGTLNSFSSRTKKFCTLAISSAGDGVLEIPIFFYSGERFLRKEVIRLDVYEN